MVLPQLIQGTGEEIAAQLVNFKTHKNLLLIVLAEEDTPSVEPSPVLVEQSAANNGQVERDPELVARVRSLRGLLAQPGTPLATEELHRERQADKVREEKMVEGYKP